MKVISSPKLSDFKKNNLCKSHKIINFSSLNKQQKNIGKNLSFFIDTYGCQANVRDSEYIKGILIAMNFTESTSIENCNLVILNTCAIREKAQSKVFGTLNYLKKLKQEGKIKYFGLCGCMAQEESNIKLIQNKFKNIDFVFGTNNISDLPNILYDVLVENNSIINVDFKNNNIYERFPEYRTNKYDAYVNVMFGCNHFCSYCIVPFTRGDIRSRNKNDIIDEVSNLKKQNCKQITLLGQNVNDYGINNNDNYFFHNLLEDVAKVGIERIKFATSNPWNFNEKIIDVMLKYKNIMPYIHLPIQSGNNQILKLMNRSCDIKQYIQLIKKIRSTIPDVCITTDIIVGFPNETRKQFRDTIKLYKKLKYDNAFTFIFSPRPGTVAAKIIDKLSLQEKRRRLNKLNKIVQKYSKINNLKYVGRLMSVLVEGPSKNNSNVLTGYTMNSKIVNFKGNFKQGDIVKVKIISASKFSLNGIAIE